MFQSPWHDWPALLSDVERTRNAKEYVLQHPQEQGAIIHPLLPLALADAVSMLRGMTRLEAPDGVQVRDTTIGRIRDLIGRVFTEKCGVNLNLELVNAKIREVGYLVLWSRIFNVLAQSKYVTTKRVWVKLKYRDGTGDRAVDRVIGGIL